MKKVFLLILLVAFWGGYRFSSHPIGSQEADIFQVNTPSRSCEGVREEAEQNIDNDDSVESVFFSTVHNACVYEVRTIFPNESLRLRLIHSQTGENITSWNSSDSKAGSYPEYMNLLKEYRGW